MKFASFMKQAALNMDVQALSKITGKLRKVTPQPLEGALLQAGEKLRAPFKHVPTK
jgi:hypothetical protein